MSGKCTLYSQTDLADYCLSNLTGKKELEIYKHLLICEDCRKKIIYIQKLGNIFDKNFRSFYEKTAYMEIPEYDLPSRTKKQEPSEVAKRFRLASLIALFIIFIGISMHIKLNKISHETEEDNFYPHSLVIPKNEPIWINDGGKDAVFIRMPVSEKRNSDIK